MTQRTVRCAIAPEPVPEWLRATISDAGHAVVDLADAEALFWYHPGPAGLEEVLRAATNLRWVQLPAAGIEAYRDHVDDRLVWTAAKGTYAEPVAEHALALALSGLRDVVRSCRRSDWGTPDGRNLFDATVVIIGGGGIAQALVNLLEPFRARVTLVRRHPAQRADRHVEVGRELLHDVLPGADLVVVAAALTPETAGILGAPEFGLLPSHAWVVNVSRGGHVVTGELVAALRDGAIGGAALDVTDPEPLPSGHPLWSFENCVITPHTANTPDMHAPLLRGLMRRNLAHWAAGEPLEGRVDPRLGY